MGKTKKKRGLFRRFVLPLMLGIALSVGVWLLWQYHGPATEQQIFQGISYGCETLPETDQSGGLLHWVRADLNVPGVDLFTTPVDPEALSLGYEYKLKFTSTAVSENGLAAGINGTLFASDSWFVRLPGDLGKSAETIVSNHVVNHVDPNTYLMWWGDNMVPHLEGHKPPRPEVLKAAKWAIGGQEAVLWEGIHAQNAIADQRTAIAADPDKKLVWICCFDKASYKFIANFLESRGAKIVIAVDGGTSKAMAIGAAAKNVRTGTITGNWRPVATQFGFRALPLP